MLGVVKELPVLRAVPPVDALNHLTDPALAVALKLAVPESQIVSGVVEVIVGELVTIAITGKRVEVQRNADIPST